MAATARTSAWAAASCSPTSTTPGSRPRSRPRCAIPRITSNFQAQYTQPLLRNFKIDQTRSNLLISELQSQITDLNLRSTLTITEASVRNAYWDLVFGIDNVEAARRNLDLSSKLVQDNRAKVEIGTMAPIDVVQAQAEEATRRQALVTAEATRRTNELALKRLIVGGTDDDLWNATHRADRPTGVDARADRPRGRRSAPRSRTGWTSRWPSAASNRTRSD